MLLNENLSLTIFILPFKYATMTSHAPAVSTCLNCGAATSANYCASCGQETRLHVASVAEFFHEFIGHYIALEGKLWQTLWLLLTRPGRLTADYIAGRRARYVAPLRVYLSLSLLFFALLKFGPVNLVVHPDDPVGKSGTSLSVKNADKGEGKPEANEEVHVSTKLGEFNPRWETRAHELAALPKDQAVALFKGKFFSYVPYLVFLIMPLFALYLKALYFRSKRSYGEHMLFALHSNAFAFILLGAILLAPFQWLAVVLFVWLLAYLPVAMRRVYGGSKRLTFARWLLLMLAYGLTLILAILAVMFTTTIVI